MSWPDRRLAGSQSVRNTTGSMSGACPSSRPCSTSSCSARGPVDQHRDVVADPCLLGARDDLLLPRHQRVPTPALDRGRHVVGQPEGARPFFVRVGEHADVVEPGVGDEPFQLGEIRVRLARKTDDEGRAQCDAWNALRGSGRAACRRSARLPGRRMRLRTSADACCSGRSMYRHTFSHSAIASRTSSVIVVG